MTYKDLFKLDYDFSNNVLLDYSSKYKARMIIDVTTSH